MQMFNAKDECSFLSDSEMVYCFSPIQVGIDTNNGVINNNLYEFKATYSQLENEPIQSYRYFLYDSERNIMEQSKEIYSNELKHAFDGFIDNKNYFISIKINTVHGMVYESELVGFSVEYVKPLFNSAVVVENVPEEGATKINAHILKVEGQIGKVPVLYQNGEWLVLDGDSYVYFNEANGFMINNENFTLKIWLKDIVEGEVFLTMRSISNMELKCSFYNQKIHSKKYIKDICISHYASNNINLISNEQTVFLFLQSINGRINIESEII